MVGVRTAFNQRSEAWLVHLAYGMSGIRLMRIRDLAI